MTREHSDYQLFKLIREQLTVGQLSDSAGVEEESVTVLLDKIETLLNKNEELASKTIIIYSDGASRGNPGPSGIGVVLEDSSGSVVAEISEYKETKTNNHVEYLALLEGLRKAAELGAKSVVVKSDSELLVRQIQGVYRVKNENLRALFMSCNAQIDHFSHFEIAHIPRSENKRADMLANRARDEAQG
jgi:ribonuclease HI